MSAFKQDCRACLHFQSGYSVQGLHMEIVDCKIAGEVQRVALEDCKHGASYEFGVDLEDWDDE